MSFIPDDDDRLWREHEPQGWFRFASPLKYGIFIVLLVCLITALWYLLSPSRRVYNPTDLALIKADEGPYKIKAQDQGLPHIKHQDKLVYGRIRNDKNEAPVEHILPDPEGPSLKMVEQYVPQEEKEAKVAVQSIADLIEDTPQIVPSPEKRKINGTIYIQLGSLPTQELAETEWGRLSKKHKNILENLDPIIQRVDLGTEKGIQYRLRTGPFETIKDANLIRTKLKEQKVECIVIK